MILPWPAEESIFHILVFHKESDNLFDFINIFSFYIAAVAEKTA